MKKIAIDIGGLKTGHAVRGIGVNTRELVDYLLKINQNDFEIVPLDFNQTSLKEFDLAHFTSFNPYYFSFPLVKSARRQVLTIHDMIYLEYPDAYPSGIKGKLRFLIQKYNLRNIDQIVTISKTSKEKIIKYLGVKDNIVDVVYLGVKNIYSNKQKTDYNYIKEKYNLPDKFILYVGGVNYNKNLNLLASAAKNINTPLVIVGKSAKDDNPKVHIENNQFIEFLQKYRDDPSIIRLGYVADEDLAVIYRVADVYCQPSIQEGFGLNALEAMASGTIVVASDIQVHREILSNAPIYFDLNKKNDLEDKLKIAIKKDEQTNKHINNGYDLSSRYTWDKTAREMLSVYRKVLL